MSGYWISGQIHVRIQDKRSYIYVKILVKQSNISLDTGHSVKHMSRYWIYYQIFVRIPDIRANVYSISGHEY